MKMFSNLAFPEGKKFAFSIIDDTDEATVENVKPVYDVLHDLGLLTTKTVWVLPTNNADKRPNRGESLNDKRYLEFIQRIRDRGFEIALHGARGGDSRRDEIEDALNQFKDIIGYYPNIHINHFINKDNLYWGAQKLDFWMFRLFYRLFHEKQQYFGAVPESEYFWGDIAQQYIKYSVNFSFHNINILDVNPRIPYHDTKRPYINKWFHTSDGGEVPAFNRLLSKGNVDCLEERGGVCLVYTHFGKAFCRNGKVDEGTLHCLKDVASRKGWFVPAGTILDFLDERQPEPNILGKKERFFLELKWVMEKLVHGAS